MRTLFFSSLLVFAFHFTVSAQVPGYMGRKLSIGVNASSFFYFDNFETISDALFSTRFSYKTEFAVSYTVARKVALGGSFYYGSQKYLVGLQQYEVDNGFGSSYGYATLEEEYMKCKLMIFEFNAKFFRRNFLAPIGPYHQFSLGMVKYNAAAPGDTLQLIDADEQNLDVVEIQPDAYSCVKLGYHIGYATPVFKNCFFNFAIGVNFFRGGDSPKIKTNLTNDTYIPGILNKHLRRHNFFEFKIGFSWLAL